MAAQAAQKFNFGDDFGADRRDGALRRAHDRAALEDAEQRGYAAGFAAGQAAQQASDDAQLAQAFQHMASALENFARDRDRFFMLCEQESVALAQHLAELHGAIVAGYDPLAGFAAAARDTFITYAQAVRIVARVPAPSREAAEIRLKALAHEVRFNGAINVEALPMGHNGSDFALEWPDGALKHDRHSLEERLRGEFERCGFTMMDKSNCDE